MTRISPVTCLLLAILAAVCAPVLGAPPALDDPLIKGVSPRKAQADQQILITGVNFGSAPEIRVGGLAATVVANRNDLGKTVAVVPSGLTPGSATVTVKNTGDGKTSNGAEIEILPGSFSPACTLSGDVTDPGGLNPVQGALVVVASATTYLFAGVDVTDSSGNYSIGLDPAGDYRIGFIAAAGGTYYEEWYNVTCSGTRDHSFTEGHPVTGRAVTDSSAPIENALVSTFGNFDADPSVLTGSNGEFTVHVRNDTIDVLVEGPVGGTHISAVREAISVGGPVDLGDVVLSTGVLVSGTARYQDEADTGPLMNQRIDQYDDLGDLAGTTTSIADGSFYLPSPTGSLFSLSVSAEEAGFEDLTVFSFAVSGATDLDYPLTIYSSTGQGLYTPVIDRAESLEVQAGQPLVLGAGHARGTTSSARFSDGLGGWVDGVDTMVEADRGGVVTTVPATADSGDVVLRVDGVDSPGYPVTVLPGTFDPGPYTTSGVIDDGTNPLENAFVGMLEIVCDEERMVSYDLTAADGSYSVAHGSGDYGLIVLPPMNAGLSPSNRFLPGVTGNRTENFTLGAGFEVTATCVDGLGEPIEDCLVEAEGDTTGLDDTATADATGLMRFYLPADVYTILVEGPFRSRFVRTDESEQTIDDHTDFGNVDLESGFLIEGRVVDPSGGGMAGVEVEAIESGTWNPVNYSATVGSDGSFLIAVPTGTYDLFFDAHPDVDLYVPPLFAVQVSSDYLAYPAVRAVDVGHIEGTVTDSVPAPVRGANMIAWHDVYGVVDDVNTCSDGTYRLRAPAGDFQVQAHPEDDACLASEYYDNHYLGCGADTVTVTEFATTAGIDFTLNPAGGISGRVEDDFGSGVAGASVCATEADSSPFCASVCTGTAEDGTYQITGVPVGSDYQVQAQRDGYPTECWDDHVNCLSYDPVSVSDCANTPGMDFLMSGAPGPVPDGHRTAGTPMTADYDKGANTLTIFWQPTCSADNHAVHFGALGDFSTYTSAECVIGVTGSHSLTPPAGDIFWVVVGVTGSTEGSYGVDDTFAERPSAGGAHCGYSQDLSGTCVP